MLFFLAKMQENRKCLPISTGQLTIYNLDIRMQGGDSDGMTEFVARLGLSILLGFIIGLERQLTGHTAGVRINVLICMGACMFLLFPMIMGSDDIYRIASYIVSGVGFLCSGVIFKQSGTVRGLNTAATLWCTAAVGVLCSSGKYPFAVCAAVLLLISNLIFRPLAGRIPHLAGGDESEIYYRISVTCEEDAEKRIRSLVIQTNSNKNLILSNLESSDAIGNKVEIEAEFYCIRRIKNEVVESMVNRLLVAPGVVKAGWELV